MNERIIVKCKHKEYELVRAWALPTVLILQRGEWGNGTVNQFNVFETERLLHSENEEVAEIFDQQTQSWDIDKLYALIHDCCEELDA